MARKKNTAGKMAGNSVREMLNKKFGRKVAHDIQENPANVTQWISTGSRWLDSITGVTMVGGIPVTKECISFRQSR